MTELMRFEGVKDPRITCNLYNGIVDELKIESYGDGGKMIPNYTAFINENDEWVLPTEGVVYDIIIEVRDSSTSKENLEEKP